MGQEVRHPLNDEVLGLREARVCCRGHHVRVKGQELVSHGSGEYADAGGYPHRLSPSGTLALTLTAQLAAWPPALVDKRELLLGRRARVLGILEIEDEGTYRRRRGRLGCIDKRVGELAPTRSQ